MNWVKNSFGESPEMLQSLPRSWFLAYYLIFSLKKACEVVINFYCENVLQSESCTNKVVVVPSKWWQVLSRVAALLKYLNDKCPGFTVMGIACKSKWGEVHLFKPLGTDNTAKKQTIQACVSTADSVWSFSPEELPGKGSQVLVWECSKI